MKRSVKSNSLIVKIVRKCFSTVSFQGMVYFIVYISFIPPDHSVPLFKKEW